MCEIKILTNYEYEKLSCFAYLQYGKNGVIKGLSDINPINGTPIIKIGRCLDDKDLISTISHESIHNTIKELFNKEYSISFDRLLYFQDYLKNGKFKGLWQDNYAILRGFFNLNNQLLI